MIRTRTIGALAVLLLSASASLAGSPTASPAITAAVADPGRPDADKLRDANRKPAEVLAFAGVRPGMVVAELASGGGYYTRILAKTVGPRGRVLAIVTAAQAARPNGLNALNTIIAVYSNVAIVSVPDYAHLTLPMKANLFWGAVSLMRTGLHTMRFGLWA